MKISRLDANDGYPVGSRQLEQPIWSDAERVGGCTPGQLLAPHRVQDEQYSGALRGPRVGQSRGNGNPELDVRCVHRWSLPRAQSVHKPCR